MTGWAAYSPEVLAALGGTGPERVAGFVFLGTPGAPLEERARPALDELVNEWSSEV